MPEKHRESRQNYLKQFAERQRRGREYERSAVLIVRNFNARLSTAKSAGFWPTVETALASKRHWLHILCESCEAVLDLDLRMKPREPEAPVSIALRDVRCPRCNGHGRPRIVGLSRFPSR